MSSTSTNSPSELIPVMRDMNITSQSSHLQSLFDEAIKKYKAQVGSTLIEDQLTILETYDSIESVAAVLEERARAFREFLGKDRHEKILKSIERVVHVFHTAFTALGGAVEVGPGVGSVVRQK
jgi:hypothetical protein